MNRPSWFADANVGAWDRVREALRRDWEQTKHDLHAGGHELNQSLKDTVAQSRGQEGLPVDDAANPPRVIARWEDAEVAIGFGYAARTHYGHRFAEWSHELESQLKSDWKSEEPWDRVKLWVRHGYEVPR